MLRHWVTENSVLNLAIAMFMNDMSLALLQDLIVSKFETSLIVS